MIVSLLIIGDELISGDVADLNGPYIAKVLGGKGIAIRRINVVGDGSIESALQELIPISDVIFTTGGLGPTHDDITIEKIAAVLDLPLEYSEAVEAHMKERGLLKIISERKELLLPKGAKPILNEIGSAPGIILEGKGVKIVALPGVPAEMRAMCNAVINEIFPNPVEGEFSRSIYFCHATEDMLADKLRELEKKNPGLFIGVYPGRSLVRVSVRGKASSKSEFLSSTDGLVGKLIDLYPTRVYNSANGLIEEAVYDQLVRKKKTIMLAESCTGGHMAAKFASIPGASICFLGSVVAYSNEAKEKLLGVSKKTLAAHGSVSSEVVIEMAEGLFRTSRADYAVSISGIAGPSGGSVDKPVGTVWACIAERGKTPHARLIQIPKVYPREAIIERATNYLLGAVWRKLAYGWDNDYEQG